MVIAELVSTRQNVARRISYCDLTNVSLRFNKYLTAKRTSQPIPDRVFP